MTKTTVKVHIVPVCDMCKKRDTAYDAKTKMGCWASLCPQCYEIYGIGLGTGKGQQLIGK